VQPELFDSFLAGGRFRDQLHIGFSVNQCRDSLAEKRMVVNAENPDWVGSGIHNLITVPNS
jgi:hypothetical protein